MAVQAILEKVTVSEYLESEALTEMKHELSLGQIVGMSGAGQPHVQITPVLHQLCRNGLKGGPCKYFDQDTKIVVEKAASSYYADGGIACPPHWYSRTAGAIDNPTVIFEVLSESTEARDRGEKFQNYALLPTLKDYVLIGSKHPRVEVFSRQEDDSWVLRAYIHGAVAHIPSVDLDLSLDELYADAEFETQA